MSAEFIPDMKGPAAAVQEMVHLLDRSQEISGNRNMNTGEAIAFLAELAEGGSAEAKELIESINDPFLEDDQPQ